MESKKAKQRLNLINKTQISFTVLYDLVYEFLRYSMYRKRNERWKANKAKQRLNLIDKTQISIKNRELNFVSLRRGVLVLHGK